MGGQYKDEEKRKATWRRYYDRSKEAINEKRRKHYEEVVWPRHLMKKYGLTVERYNEIAASQNYVCAITGLPPESGTKLEVDHCHVTNTIRGLIRKEINKAIGAFRDNPEWLKRAAEYVKGFKH